MSFTYTMIERDAQELYEHLQAIHSLSFNLMRVTNQGHEMLSEEYLRDITRKSSKLQDMLMVLNRKVEHLKTEAERNKPT